MRRCSALCLFICASDSAARVCGPVCVSHHLQSVSTWLRCVHHRSVEIAALQIPPGCPQRTACETYQACVCVCVCSIPPEVNAEVEMPWGRTLRSGPLRGFQPFPKRCCCLTVGCGGKNPCSESSASVAWWSCCYRTLSEAQAAFFPTMVRFNLSLQPTFEEK